MTPVASDAPAVTPIVTAGLLLAALPFLQKLGLPGPSATDVIVATNVSRSRAYEMRASVLDALPALQRPPGRPADAPAPARDTSAITREMLIFLMIHPGAVTPGDTRYAYSDRFRHRVLELAEAHPDLDRASLAEAVGVPLATLQDWLAAPATSAAPPAPPAPPDPEIADLADATHPQIAAVLDAWRRWDGGFASFCAFVRDELAIPFGISLVRRILDVHAGRRRKRRSGRSPDEKSTRNALITFFPGAQWFGDGSAIALTLNGQPFSFHWELDADGASGAFVGASLRDEEDAQAVVNAFQDGVATTGAPPIALTTDNRASNLAPEVDVALDKTLHIHTTLGRPQNDAPIEGAFGLFGQTAPPLVVHGDTPRELAHAILTLVLTIWARATNHRPRNDRQGRTRVQLYQGETPTDAQIAAARAALEERRRLQERANRTRQARLDPVVRALLDDAFARLGLHDPTGNVRDAIARYPLDAVLAGIATFDGKRLAGTLPPDAGPRYLLGIVRQIALRDEGLAIAEALWKARLDARDRALLRLEADRRATLGTPDVRVRAFIDRALDGDGPLLHDFWVHAAATVILEQPVDLRKDLYDRAARRAATSFRAHPHHRQAVVRHLAAQVLPVA